MMAEENIRINLQIFVRGTESAELAVVHRVRIREVAAETVYVLAEVLLARLTRRRIDRHIFDGCTSDLSASDR